MGVLLGMERSEKIGRPAVFIGPFGMAERADNGVASRLTATISPKPSKPVYRRENGLRPGPYTDIIREVHPPDRAGRVDEELSGPRDVFTSFAALRMQHSVLPNGVSPGIGEKWKCVTSGLAELL